MAKAHLRRTSPWCQNDMKPQCDFWLCNLFLLCPLIYTSRMNSLSTRRSRGRTMVSWHGHRFLWWMNRTELSPSDKAGHLGGVHFHTCWTIFSPPARLSMDEFLRNISWAQLHRPWLYTPVSWTVRKWPIWVSKNPAQCSSPVSCFSHHCCN